MTTTLLHSVWNKATGAIQWSENVQIMLLSASVFHVIVVCFVQRFGTFTGDKRQLALFYLELQSDAATLIDLVGSSSYKQTLFYRKKT